MDNCFGIACQPARVSPVNIGQCKHPLESFNMPASGSRLPEGGRNMDSAERILFA
jgi:hypothetical protein